MQDNPVDLKSGHYLNAPMVASSVGIPVDPTEALLAPRPFAPDENIFEYQRTGRLNGNIFVFGVSRNAGNHGTFNVDFAHISGVGLGNAPFVMEGRPFGNL